MKILIGFMILAVCQARYRDPICEDVIVNNIQHEKEILVAKRNSPYQLVIDYDTHILFYSYSTEFSGNNKFSSAFYNLKTNEYGDIPDVLGGFANTVDNKNHIVYLGGSDGLYTFNFGNNTATHVYGTYHNIWQMFFKNDVYYSTFPDEHVYIFKDGKTEEIVELADTRAMLVALNNKLDFYFTNSSGLFKLIRSNNNIIYLGDYNVNALTADNNGNLYFSTPSGIYSINEKDEIMTVALIPNIYGVAVEGDGNIIYSAENALVRLKPSNSPCYINEKD